MNSDDAAAFGASLIPMTDAQAELAKTAVEETGKLGRYVARILGDFPSDFIQVAAGQHFRFARVIIADGYDRKITAILDRRNAKVAPVSPSIGVPLLEAAYEEMRPELQDLWAALIAAAMDDARAPRLRLRFIETVKQMDPIDALILKERARQSGGLQPNAVDYFVRFLSRGPDEIAVSAENLERLGCFIINPAQRNHFNLTAYGRELVRACSD